VSAAPATNASLPGPFQSPLIPDGIPTWITAGAIASSGHFPRVLELAQFLSLLCSSLSMQQQNRVSQYQITSLTHVARKAGHCSVCPGACIEPLVLVMPTFTLIICLFALGVGVAVYDAHKVRSSTSSESLGHGRARLLAADAASPEDHISLRCRIIAKCLHYFRGFMETSSSFVLMPGTFVFVLNIQPSSFNQADVANRFMILAVPVMTLLFRILVVRQRVVQMSLADQKLIYIGCFCSCAAAVIFGLYFDRVGISAAPSLTPTTSPQYMALVVLLLQVLAQTIVRQRATEPSILDNTDWPWSSADRKVSSAVFSFKELPARLIRGSIKNACSAATIAVAKFVMLNHVVLSQVAMLIAGIASSVSFTGSVASSDFIGLIPLTVTGLVLLYNTVKIASVVWRKCFQRLQPADRSVGSTENVLL
jgi:hypothetical protein